MTDNIIGDNTNRDFQSQFIELLDLAKKLNSSYDPSVSSESDPIVVLMKEMAMMGDKLEYNKDKAARELFPSTVQQRSNAQELYDMLGYHLKGWRSATGYVRLSLSSTDSLMNAIENNGITTITIPRFTRLTDANGLYNYVTTAEVTFDLANLETQDVAVIEGNIKTLEVGGVQTIGIINMDENYRVYFPETNIAENGVFISFTETIGSDFVMVDNPYMLTDTNVYSIGEGENGEKYVQFPETIVDTLGTENTITIRYVTSTGAAGMCKAKTLTLVGDEISINGDSGDTITDSITVVQPTATIGGQDPETIEDAYRNFKKTQGTFETLVTERDYESFAYEAEYDNAPLYSNVVVASRTSDINRTVKIKTLKNWANRDIYKLIEHEDDSVTPTPYDVWIYGMQSSDDYETQFYPVEAGSTIDILNEQVLDVKAVQQVVQEPNGDKRFFWNEYTLIGTVLLKNRVTASEKQEIEKNMWAALKEYLGARNMTFGETINYEGTVDAIVNSDSRILSVILNLPFYQIKEVDLTAGTTDAHYLTIDEKIDLIAKMALAGNVQLLSFDERFTSEFGIQQQSAQTKSDNEGEETNTTQTLPLEGVSTLASGVVDAAKIDETGTLSLADLQNPQITVGTEENKTQIRKNEVLSLIGDKYETSVEYSTWVNVLYENNATTIALTTDKHLTTTSSILKAGSSLHSEGTELVIYAVTNGTASTVELAQNINIGTGSIIKSGSTVATGSIINGSTINSNTKYATDTTISQESTLASGSLLYHNTVLINPVTSGTVFDIDSDTAIGSGSILAAGSQIAIGSTLNGTLIQSMLPQNTNYRLDVGEKITVEYQDDSGVLTTKEYPAGTIIETDAEIGGMPSAMNNTATTLQSGDYLRIKSRVSSALSKGTYYYFIGNENLYIPARSQVDNEYVPGTYRLGDQEYLVYTSAAMDELMILNPGTLLENTTDVALNDTFVQINLSDITSADALDVSWHTLPTAIEAYDQEIIAFGEGASFYMSDSTKSMTLGREYKPLTSAITITQDNSTASYYQVLEGQGDTQTSYEARYTLNISMTNTQELQAGQFIWANFETDEQGELINGTVFAPPTEVDGTGAVTVTPVTIESSEPLVLSGGEIWSGLNVDITMYTETYAVDVLHSDTSATTSSAIDAIITNNSNSVEHPTRLADRIGGFIEIVPNEEPSKYLYVRLNYTVNSPTLLPIYIRTNGSSESGGSTTYAQWQFGVGENLSIPKCMILSNGEPTALGNNGVITSAESDANNDKMYVLYLEPQSTTTPQEKIYIMGTDLTVGSFLQIGKPLRIATSGGTGLDAGLNAAEINVTNEDCIPGTGEGTAGFVARDVFVLSDTYGENSTNAKALLARIGELDADGEFDYTYQVPDEEKVVQPTKSENYFDANHWANKYTIPKMDLEKSMRRLTINPGQIIRG